MLKKNLIYSMGVEINKQKHKPNGYSDCEPEQTNYFYIEPGLTRNRNYIGLISIDFTAAIIGLSDQICSTHIHTVILTFINTTKWLY